MYIDILSEEQKRLLPIIKKFSKEFYLVGGTAIALQKGHRRSIDFDLFKKNRLTNKKYLNTIDKYNIPYSIIYKAYDQLHIIIQGVKITFFQYDYTVGHDLNFEDITMPDLLTLAAMKAFALGRRSKWKDYVDLYFLIRDDFSVDNIIKKAEALYGQEFSSKLFKAQLTYHADINYTESVDFLPNWEVSEETIKSFLIDKALE